MRRWLGLLALGQALSAGAAEPAALDAAVAVHCAAYTQPWPAEQPLQLLNERLRAAQVKADPFALEGACQGLRRVVADRPGDVLARLRYQSDVAAALFWLGRAPQSTPLFEALVAAYQATGRRTLAAQSAAMLAFVYLQRGENTTALQWSTQAFEDAAQPDPEVVESDRLNLRINHVVMLSSARRFPEAERAIDELFDEVARLGGSALQRATLHSHQSVLKRRQGQQQASLAAVDAEIALRREIWPQEPFGLVVALSNRGVALQSLARWQESEEALREGVATADRSQGLAPDLSGHAVSVREQLSSLLLARGDPAGAAEVARHAVALMAERPERDAARGARPWRRLGEAQLAQGALAEGLASLQQALQRLGPGRTDGDTLPLTRLSVARALLEVGDTQGAAEQLQLLDADARPPTPDETAFRHSLEAALQLREGGASGVAEALRHWAAADEALAKGLPPSHPQRQVLTALRCEWDDAACVPTDAAHLNPESEAVLRLSQARKALRAGAAANADRAAQAAQEALLAATTAAQPRLQWQALDLLAQAQQQRGHPAQAILLGKLAIALLQGQREALLPLGRQADARYLADKLPLYRRVADALLQAGRLPEARQVLDLLKAQEQFDFGLRAASPAATGELDFTAAEQAARREFDAWLLAESGAELQRLRQLESAGRLSAAERERLQWLAQADRDRQATRRAGLDAALARLQAVPAQPSARRALTRPATGVLQVYTLAGDEALSLLFVHARGAYTQRLPWRLAALGPAIARWRDALEQGTLPAAEARALQEALGGALAQAAQQARAQRIVLVLDGPSRYLPPALLADRGESARGPGPELVVQAPGPAARAAAADAAGALRASAFGVTRALQGLPALPGVADELCGIVQGSVAGLEDPASACGGTGTGPWPGEGHLNEAFTEARLVGLARQQPDQLLHLGTHFVLRPGNVSRSWLLLGDGARLHLDRLRQLALGQPRLVTLSACETAVGVQADGREVDGLATALIDGGAQEVVASLWRVEDAGTARFMRRFYAALAAHRGQAAAALRQAQREAQRAGEPARIWAAFVLLRRADA